MTKRERQGLVGRIARMCIIGNRFPGIRKRCSGASDKGAKKPVSVKTVKAPKRKISQYVFYAVPRNIAVSDSEELLGEVFGSSAHANFSSLEPVKPKVDYDELRWHAKLFVRKPDRRRHDRLKDKRVGSMQTIRQMSPDLLREEEEVEYI